MLSNPYDAAMHKWEGRCKQKHCHSGVSLTGLKQKIIQSIFNIGLDFTLIITVKKELKICSLTQLSLTTGSQTTRSFIELNDYNYHLMVLHVSMLTLPKQ